MKNKIKMGLALLMFATVIPNTAFAQDSSNQFPSEQVEFADIYIGDELITVPVVIESEIAGKTARSGVQYEDTIESATYYIPVTEEGKVYNEEYVMENLKENGGVPYKTDNYSKTHIYGFVLAIIVLFSSLIGVNILKREEVELEYEN